jgi:hypothetical protein
MCIFREEKVLRRYKLIIACQKSRRIRSEVHISLRVGKRKEACVYLNRWRARVCKLSQLKYPKFGGEKGALACSAIVRSFACRMAWRNAVCQKYARRTHTRHSTLHASVFFRGPLIYSVYKTLLSLPTWKVLDQCTFAAIVFWSKSNCSDLVCD